ncbi:DinB family protein [Bacillus spongiae]|uniref:DinB family protein n=1 Tax=Bacillus spongiae TaxID=2683610 RepID=A0ABU8HC45_9BACI
MNKSQIVQEKERYIDWVYTLKNMSDALWYKPFKEESWATADVIAHLIHWDQFVIENRIPYFINDEALPNIAVDVEAINKEASEYARGGVLKDELIDKFIFERRQLITSITTLPATTFDQPFAGRETIKIGDYFVSTIDHDLHHQKQIVEFIKSEGRN